MFTAFQPNAFQQDAFQINHVTGTISTTDALDSGSLNGLVIAVDAGVIYAVDALDTASIQGTVTAVPSNIDTHDGFTAEEIRRAKELDKKAAKARLKLFEAQKAQKALRKQQIRDTIEPPVAKIQQPDLESVKQSKDKALEQVIKASAAVKRLEEQRKELYLEVQLRQEQARIITELAIKRARELDEDEAILALLM